jgi:hypothetical protein
MSSDEGSAQTLESRDEPTASAPKANSARVANWWIWGRLVAVIAFVVLVLAVFFFAGFYAGTHYGGPHYREDFLVPVPGQAGPCSQLVCQPVGPKGGATCYQVKTC